MNKYRHLITFLIICLLALQSALASPIKPSTQEKMWLNDGGQISMSVSRSGLPPFTYVQNNQPTGYLIDYINLIGKKAGVPVSWTLVNNRAEERARIQNDLDNMITSSIKKEYRDDFYFGDIIVPRVIHAFTRKDANITINRLEDIFPLRVATQKNFTVTKLLKEKYPQLTLVESDSVEESIAQISAGKADVLFTDYAIVNYILRTALINNIESQSSIDEISNLFKPIHVLYSRSEPVHMMTLLEKARASISPKELQALQDKWLLNQPQQAYLNLTQQEQEWIKRTPVIRTNNLSDSSPFDFNENGKPSGYSVEYLKLLGQKAGLTFEFIQGNTWSEFKQFAEDRHIDMLHLASKTDDRERYLSYTYSYYTGSPNLLYGRKSQAIISNFEQLANKRVAVLRDGVEQRHLSQNYPSINLFSVDTNLDGLNSVLKGEADYFLCYPSICDTYIAQKFLTNLESRGHLGIEELEKPKKAHFAVRNDWPELVSILNKAILAVTTEEKKQLREKWFNRSYSQKSLIESLTDAEKLWLDSNRRLVFSQPKKYSPYSYVDSDGVLGGLASDLIKEFNSQYKVDSYYVDYPNWSETYQALLEGKIDYIPTININEKRKQEVLLTTPILTYNLTIFSHDDGPYFNNLDELAGYRVGISKNSSVANLLKANYPNLNFVTYKNGVDVYRALSDGKIDAAAASPHVMYHTINEYNLENIVASAETEFRFELAIAVNKSKPELLTLFNRMITSLGQDEIDKLMDKWTTVKIVHRTDWQSIIFWVLGVTLLLITLSTILITLNKAKTIKILAENDKRLTNAQRVAKIGSWELNDKRELVQISPQIRTLLGLGSEFSLTQEDYRSFVHPDDLEGIKQSWKRALKTGLYQHEYRISVGNEEKWVREVAELTFESNGKLNHASGIVQDITERKIAELKVIQNENELRSLTSKLLNVQEEERRRVARELHDDLSQRLAVLSLSIGTLEQDKDLLPAKDKLNAVKQNIITVAKDIHGISRRLHPSILDDLGLIDALKSEIKNYVDREMIAVDFETTANKVELGKEAELGLFRITQESLRNIAKYSEASKVQVTLSIINQHLILKVMDDGIGFDVQEAMLSPGLGLQSITERARLIKAKLDIQSSDQGTTITVDLPLDR